MAVRCAQLTVAGIPGAGGGRAQLVARGSQQASQFMLIVMQSKQSCHGHVVSAAQALLPSQCCKPLGLSSLPCLLCWLGTCPLHQAGQPCCSHLLGLGHLERHLQAPALSAPACPGTTLASLRPARCWPRTGTASVGRHPPQPSLQPWASVCIGNVHGEVMNAISTAGARRNHAQASWAPAVVPTCWQVPCNALVPAEVHAAHVLPAVSP